MNNCFRAPTRTIIGSNAQEGWEQRLETDARSWWRIDHRCDHLANDIGGWLCCPASTQDGAHRLLASIWLFFDPHNQRYREGECGIKTREGGEACAQQGYLAHWGTKTVSDVTSLIVKPLAQHTGPVGAAGGWYLTLDRGAPVELTLASLEVHPDVTLMLALSYPKGTAFAISMHAGRSRGTPPAACVSLSRPARRGVARAEHESGVRTCSHMCAVVLAGCLVPAQRTAAVRQHCASKLTRKPFL